MQEQVTDATSLDPTQTVDQPLTFEDIQEQLQQLPDGHPSRLLRPHVERLLAAQGSPEEIVTPGIATAISTPTPKQPALPAPTDTVADGQDQSKGERDTTAGDTLAGLGTEGLPPHEMAALIEEVRQANSDRTGPYDASLRWYNIQDDAQIILEQGDYSPEQLAAFVHETRQAADKNAAIPETENQYALPDYFYSAIEHVPREKLQAVYQTPELSSGLRYMLEHADSNNEIQTALATLQAIYNVDDPLDLYEPAGGAADDPTVHTVISNVESGRVITERLTAYTTEWPEGGNPDKEETAKRKWAGRYLNLVAGLPEKQCNELLFATYLQTTDRKTGHINSVELLHRIESTYLSTHGLTTEQLVQLRETAGIVNFGNYSKRQLQFMSDFVNGDPATIEHLKRGDTTIVLADARGDHNGFVRGAAKNFDSEQHRTLFFEINRPSDLYRHMLTVNGHDVKPSTMAITAHGDPGRIYFGPDWEGFTIFNTSPDPRSLPSTAKQYVAEAYGLPRVIRDMMQDSRGIDDNPENAGRRRLIFASCSQAQPVAVTRYHTAQTHTDHDVRDTAHNYPQTSDYTSTENESLAATVTKTAQTPNLDVFAGKYPLNLVRTEAGIKFYSYVDNPEFQGNVPFNATRYTLDNQGNLVEESVAEIILRSVDSKAGSNAQSGRNHE